MKTLKKTLLLCLTALSFTACNAQWGNGKTIKGNGNVTTITRTTSDYDAIRLAGWMDFKLVKGTEGKITIEGESNLLEYIITEVNSDDLVIKTENNTNLKPSGNKTIIITIPFEDIEKVSLAGSGDVTSNATINADSFSASVSGSGDVTLDVRASNVKGSITGSGDLTLTGDTKNLKARVTGSGDIEYKGNPEKVDTKITGSGDISN